MKAFVRVAASPLAAIFFVGAVPASAAVVQGTFEGVVNFASDPGEAAFGRDPASWLGKTVTGTFRYDIEAVPAIDDNPDPSRWNYVLPGGGEWIEMRATIDGVEFTAVRPGEFISGNVQIWDDSFGSGDWFSVQAAGGNIGRQVVVFDAFGPPSLFSYSGGDGSFSFDFDPAAGAFGRGLIEDLYDPNGVVERHGVIRFQLTALSFGRTAGQIIDDLADTVSAKNASLRRTVQNIQTYYDAGDAVATCAQLDLLESQVAAFSRWTPSRCEFWPRSRCYPASPPILSPSEAQQILADTAELKDALGCE